MPTVLQHRRGTSTQNDAFTGSAGELTIDLTNDTIRVHDGSTAGGKRLATKAEADAALSAAAGLDSAKAIALIDSSYVTARIPATPTLGGSFVDSAEARKTISVTDAGGDGSLSYNNSTGVLTYTGPSASEVRAHISAGEGIDISSGEISGEDATTTNKGIASFATANFTVASGAVSLKSDGINDTHIDFGTGTNQVSTADLPEETNLYFTNARAKSAAVADAINDGTTDVAPSQNAVFDALALKLDASAVPTLSADFIDSAEAIKLIDSSYVQARQSGGEITIQEEGSSLSTAATTLNFVGSGVTASGTGTTKTITISGGGSGTVDSAAVIALMDSASRHTFGLVSVTNDASNGQSGQAEVQADAIRDLLNFEGGPGLAITTNASQDKITFTPVNQFDSAEALKLIPTLGADFVDSAEVNTLIDARDTHDSAAVQGQIDSAVNSTFINNLTIDADTLGGQNGAYYRDYNNLTNTPTIPTLGGSFVDSAFVTSEINSLVDAAPGALNTLNELAAAIGDDANFSTTITNSIAAKLDSAQTIAIIDSAYVLARAPAQDFLDSAEAIALIDSAYVQARQSATGGTDPIFKTIAVAGQSSIVAETTTDTLTVVGSTGITVTTTAGTDTLTLATTDGDIVHDNLSGFVANEHIDHTSVSLIAGKGLSGGGTIAADRTIDIDSANVRGMFSGGTGITYDSGTGAITTTDGDIVHDNLSGFVANEHIDHSGVSIIAGNGLLGGGTIASSRTINIDSANIDVMIDSNLAGSSVLINGNGSTGGITLSDGLIDIRTGTGAVSKIKFYCETNNAHFQTLQAQPHSAGSSGVIVLPIDSGTLALTSQIPTLGTDFVDSAQTNILIDARDTHDSAAVKGQIDSAVPALIDSSYVQARQAAGSGITIQEEGSSLSTLGTTLNFVGSTVTASGTGATKTITISGSGGGGLDSALTTQLIDSSYVSDRALGGLGQNEFLYTATNNQTTFSGNDKKGNSLAYTADRIFVHLNGVLLNDSDDYTASNGTSVVLTTGATTNDELRVSAFGIATPPVTTGKAIAMAIVFGG